MHTTHNTTTADVLADLALGSELDHLLNRAHARWQVGDERHMEVDVADTTETDDDEVEIWMRHAPRGREGAADGARVLAPRAELEANIIGRGSRREDDGDDVYLWESEGWWEVLRIDGRWYLKSYNIRGGSGFDGPALALARSGEVLEAQPLPRYVRQRVAQGEENAPKGSVALADGGRARARSPSIRPQGRISGV